MEISKKKYKIKYRKHHLYDFSLKISRVTSQKCHDNFFLVSLNS